MLDNSYLCTYDLYSPVRNAQVMEALRTGPHKS
jgi:hypothetical protein